ncbi:UNVERIFIED_CONTAM: hypothetical protein K2H54_047946 [Gekko kuhli]
MTQKKSGLIATHPLQLVNRKQELQALCTRLEQLQEPEDEENAQAAKGGEAAVAQPVPGVRHWFASSGAFAHLKLFQVVTLVAFFAAFRISELLVRSRWDGRSKALLRSIQVSYLVDKMVEDRPEKSGTDSYTSQEPREGVVPDACVGLLDDGDRSAAWTTVPA